MPIFPTTAVCGRTAFMISPTSVVVVVLPFVPVIAVIWQGVRRYASSTSLSTGTPAASAACIKGKSQGIPGLSTIISCSQAISSGFFPVQSRKPSCSSCSALGMLSRFFISCSVTSAPSCFSNAAAAMPLFAIPQTSAFFPLYSIPIPSFR